jgi:hypothetical protein
MEKNKEHTFIKKTLAMHMHMISMIAFDSEKDIGYIQDFIEKKEIEKVDRLINKENM